MLIYCAVFFWR